MKNIGIAGIALVIFGCQSQSPLVYPEKQQLVEEKQSAAVNPETTAFEGQVQLRLNEGAELEQFVFESFQKHQIRFEPLDAIPEADIFLLRYSSEAFDSKDVLEILRQSEQVESFSKNYQVTAGALDPDLNLQWGLKNTGQEAPKSLAGTSDADIDFFEVETKGSRDVVVAVIDTGVDYLHEDLAVTEVVDGKRRVVDGNLWINPEEIPGNNRNEDNNGDRIGGFVDDVFGYNFVGRNGDPRDDHGHGTHVAGVIGALRNNFKGIHGMNEEVSIMGLKFLSATGGGSSFDAAKSLYYVMQMQRRFPKKRFITNNSWGSSGREADSDETDFLLEAFNRAGKAGILSVVAAGNSAVSNDFSPSFPSNYSTKVPAFISVAATNNNDQLAGFSSWGNKRVQVAAPGVMIQSTIINNRYAAWSGTSMATPHVAGLAALIWAKHPDFSAEEVKNRILNSVDILPQLKGYVSSGGRINVRRALEGDLNVGIDPVEEEIQLRIESPEVGHSGGIDHITEIHQEGAQQIQVCFEEIFLVDSQDWLQVYGNDYLVKDLVTGIHVNRNRFTGDYRELCTAPVQGDRVFLRLFNGGGAGAGSQGPRKFTTEKIRVVRQ